MQIQKALELGFGIQIICQKRLSYSQESQIRDFLKYKDRLEICFFIEESANPLGELNYFCENFSEYLSISLTRFSFGLLSELDLFQIRFKFLRFFDFAAPAVYSFSQALENTNYGRSTMSFRKKPLSLPVNLFLRRLSHSFSLVFLPTLEKVVLDRSTSRIYWKVHSFISLTYQFLCNYPFWPFRKLYWVLKNTYHTRVLKKFAYFSSKWSAKKVDETATH